MKKNIKIIILALILVCSILALVGCNNANPLDTTYDTVKITKMNNFTHLNENAKHGEVVMIGDSIVEIYNTHEHFSDINKIVYNRGISGDTSDRMLERMSNALDIEPSTLFVLIGTNDIGKGIPREETLSNTKKIIEKAKNSGVPKIVIESVYPVNHSINTKMVGRRKNKDIIEYNKSLKTLCNEQNVIYVDLFSALVDEKGNFKKSLTYDGLHPNDYGYDVITNVLKDYID